MVKILLAILPLLSFVFKMDTLIIMAQHPLFTQQVGVNGSCYKLIYSNILKVLAI